MSGPNPRWKHTRPQLFGMSRAAAQARRAAGCAIEGEFGSAFNENPRPITGWISTRSFIRRMARLNGAKARALSTVAANHRAERINALGLIPARQLQRDLEAQERKLLRRRRWQKLLRIFKRRARR